MSALWHDPELNTPIKRFETPLVQKTFDDLPVPTEHHELPDGVQDPFAKLDAVYDAAAVQMERGIKGSEFLNGTKRPPKIDEPPIMMAAPQERPLDVDPAKQTLQKMEKQEREHHRQLDQAAVVQPGSNSGGTKTAAQKETEKAANAGQTDVDSAVSIAATFGPMAAAQAVTTVAQGPLPVLASQAVQTAGAVASAAELGMVGVTEGLKEEPAAPPRRGLSKK